MGLMQLSHGPSSEGLKRAFGSFATGVAIIGICGPDGGKVGMTVNSLTSVSMDPPLLLFCPSRALAGYEMYEAAQHFTVSILPEHTEPISNHFARSGIDKWGTIPHRVATCGAPYLENALGVMECVVVDRHPAGDHLIVLGRVLRLMVSAAEEPLIFFRSRYRHLAPQREPNDRNGPAQIDVWG